MWTRLISSKNLLNDESVILYSSPLHPNGNIANAIINPTSPTSHPSQYIYSYELCLSFVHLIGSYNVNSN